MRAATVTSKLAQPFDPVNSQLPLFPETLPGSVIHHKPREPRRKEIISYSLLRERRGYGVSSSRRILSPQSFLKRYDKIRDFLEFTLGFSTAEREATQRLLRFWAYYGHVYVKQSQVSTDPGVSKATYWRAIRRLRDLGLIRVVNRFVIRPHAQISNRYELDQLVIVLARYLAEHGAPFRDRFLLPALAMPGRQFWAFLSRSPGDRAGPALPMFEGLLSSRVAAS